MTASIPESQLAEGNVKAAFIPAISNLSTGPTVAEMTAGVIITSFLMPEWDGLTGEQNTGDDRRFSSRQSFERLGRTTNQVAPLKYTYLPQELGTPGHDANEVYETLAPGTTGYLVIGYGLDAEGDAAFAANDVVDLVPVECGEQFPDARGENEFSPLTVTQKLGVTGLRIKDREIAA